MLELNNVNIIKRDGDRPLLKDFSFSLAKGDKTAIIGEEGDGKSTLLKFIYDPHLIDSYCRYDGVCKAEGKLGYLSQFLESEWLNSPFEDFFFKTSPSQEADYALYNESSFAQECLIKTGMDPNLLFSQRKLSSFSGGEKVKIRIAKILFSRPTILLLDEPTNDLDLPSLQWMEGFIKDTPLPVLFVSHDETLLSRTANRIIHLEQIAKKKEAKFTIAGLGYEDYIQMRLALIDKQNQLAVAQETAFNDKKDRFLHLYDSVKYQQANLPKAGSDSAGRLMAKKMKALLAQRSKLEKAEVELTQRADVEEALNLQFDQVEPLKSGSLALAVSLPFLKAGDKKLTGPVELKAYGQDKIVIIGANGIGKTTLLRLIYEEIKKNPGLKVGYMPQNYEEAMDYSLKAIDFICPSLKKEDRVNANNFLGAYRFSPEEMASPVGLLSSGQRGKLFLAKFILEKDNFLLLDEPTRNFSPLSNPVIREALAGFEGGFIAVSHDRLFIKEAAEKIFLLEPLGLKEDDKIREEL